MKQIKIYTFILSIVLISCSNSISDVDTKEQANTKNTDKKIETINDEKPKDILSSLPDNWAMLSNTKDGLIIYLRNNKLAYTLDISNDTMIKGGYMENVKWKIMRIEKINERNFVFHLGEKFTNKTFGRDTIEIINSDTFLSFHSWYVLKLNENGEENILGYGRNLIIPFDKKDLFKNVEEPNLKTPESGITFIDIDFEKVRKMYSNK